MYPITLEEEKHWEYGDVYNYIFEAKNSVKYDVKLQISKGVASPKFNIPERKSGKIDFKASQKGNTSDYKLINTNDSIKVFNTIMYIMVLKT